MRALGVATTSKAKMLGGDFASGRKLKRTVQGQRLLKAKGRRLRIRKLGKKAAGRIIATGVGPALRYGVAVVGASNSLVSRARRTACGSYGKMGGRSQFGRLQLAEYDIGQVMAVDPIVAWAKGVWDGLVDRQTLAKTWKAATIEVLTSANPFTAVRGPAGAMLASLTRLEWKAPSPFHFLTKRGGLLDLDVVCPFIVGRHAREELAMLEAAGSTLAQRIGGPPNLDPMKAYLRSQGY